MRWCRGFSLLILIVLVLLLNATGGSAALKNPRANKHQEAAAHPTNSASQQQQPQVPLAVFQATQASLLEALRTIRNQAEAAAKQKHPQYEPWYAPSVLAQFGLIGVGLLYSFFAWRQWTAIHEQAKVARVNLTANRLTLNAVRRAADAAKENADIAKEAADSARTIDRAWLMLDSLSNPELVPMPIAGAPPPPVQTLHSYRNFGKTPAFITASTATLVQIPDLSALPPEPAYNPIIPSPAAQGIPLVPETSTQKVSAALIPKSLLSQDEIDTIQRRDVFLYAFGVVRYRDVFDQSHETRWGYLFSIPSGFDHYRGWIMAGPPTYNRHD